jgi:hypothetical protein
MDGGWTQWVFDAYQIPYTALRNGEIQKGRLRERFDTIVFASQNSAGILHGIRPGQDGGGGRGGASGGGGIRLVQRPEYTGGIAVPGLAQIDEFVRSGGTLIALDSATELPVEFFPLGVRSLLRSSGTGEASAEGYYCPGSILRITVDTTHPIAFGMPKEAFAFSQGGQAFEISDSTRARSIARYAAKDLLASGWLSGERAVLGRHILVEADHGQGRVILFGFRPQFRGQTFGTFRLLLNAIYLGSARKL